MSTITLSIRLTPEDYRKLQAIATDTGASISDVGREAIARYLGRSGAGSRVRCRLDALEDRVNRLTLLATQPQGTRAEQAEQYLKRLN